MVGIMKFGLFAVFVQLATAKIGDHISPCRVDDPLLNECVVTQANALMPIIAKGIKEFGILSLDPLQVPLMEMKEGLGGVKGISFNVTNSKHYGWKDMKFTSAKIDPKNYRFELNALTPVYTVIGDYEVKGRILVLPIVGSGFTNMTFLDLASKLVFSGKPDVRNGKTYMHVDDVDLSFGTSRTIVRLDNLFGNKQLSDQMNQVLNENSVDAFNELKPAFEVIFSGIYNELLSRMFQKIPYNQLFKGIQ